jgi:prepilin-type N-terminal cleavage/methylation domain-containing protein
VSNGRQAERGFSLVELLVTVVIMGVAFTAVLSAIGTFHRTSTVHRETANFDFALRTYTAQLAAAPYVTSCPASYNVSAPAGYTPSITVRYWNGSPTASYGSSCPAADTGSQQLTVTLTKNGRSDTVSIVKRRS